MPAVRGSLVVVLVGLLVVGGAYWFDGRNRLAVGEQAQDRSIFGDEGLASSSFLVPGARVEVGADAGQRTAVEAGEQRLRAPRRGALLGISSSTRPTPNRYSGEAETSRGPSSAVLRVRVRGETVLTTTLSWVWQELRAGQTREPAHEVVVAVPDPGRDVVAELEYAGRRQSVDLATGERKLGSFAALYRPAGRGADAVGSTSERDRIRSTTRGSVAWTRNSYRSDVGWARSGREWLVLTNPRLEVSGLDARGRTRYVDIEPVTPTQGTGSITVDNGRPVGVRQTRLDQGSSRTVRYEPGTIVYDVPAGAATTIRMSLRTQLEEDDDGKRKVVAYATNVAIPVPAQAEAGADR